MRNITTTLLLCLLLITILPSCAPKQQAIQDEDIYTLDTIVVLPTETIRNRKMSNNKAQELETGSVVVENFLRQYLSKTTGTKFISDAQIDALLTTYQQDRYASALEIGRQLQGDAILTSRINRYSERQGKEYAVDKPASASFEYRLLLTETGQTLCAGVFDETQKAWTENILSFKQIVSRGGKWITVEQFTQEGLEEIFSSCRYF